MFFRIEKGVRFMIGIVGLIVRILCNVIGELRLDVIWLKDGRLIREDRKYVVEDFGILLINFLDVRYE